jgi:hypothetical protein
MLSRLSQVTKVVCYAAALAFLLQPGGLGCTLACARTASITNQHECHASTQNSALATPVANAAFSAEHACCHNSTSKPREAVSPKLVNTFHHVAVMMPCCALASQIIIPALKQRVATAKISALTKDKTSTQPNVEFRAAPLIGQSRLPNRGATYLRRCVLLI